jgi:hypothetical protein
MPSVDPKDLIWIQDAMKEFNTTRYVINGLIDDRKLTVVKLPGQGEKIYLLRSELAKQLAPKIVQEAEDQATG